MFRAKRKPYEIVQISPPCVKHRSLSRYLVVSKKVHFMRKYCKVIDPKLMREYMNLTVSLSV
jgi:hypothetical protein